MSRERLCRRHFNTAYDDVNTVRVQFNTWHRGRQLIDFVILVQRLGANGWEDVERFDCCHGCCHLHQDGRDGNDPLWQLDDEKDVPEAFVRACDQAETRARIIRNKGKDVKK